MRLVFRCVILFLLCLLFKQNTAFADEFSSTNFKVLDPVIAPSEYSTSTGFRLWSTISEVAVGTSSIAGYNLGGGFLRFPFASTPAVSATAGNAQVSLSWTSSVGYLGWTASSYDVAQSTTSGGPYSYSSLANVTSSTRTGLTNGTTYYFVVVVKDAFGNPIASSTEVSSTPAGSSNNGGGGGGGGGGGSGGGYADTGVIFSGRAYPLSKVSVLKDGQLAVTTIAGPDSNFTTTLSGLSAGNYTFSVYGEDKNGVKSVPFTFPIYITSGVTTKISGIFIAPTIAVDKSQVKKGDNIAIFGQSSPNSEITININSDQELFIQRPSDKDGIYLLNFDTAILELGQHSTKSKAALKNEISPFSNTVAFKVGTENVLVEQGKCQSKGDLNGDCKVNLVDFSIAAFWYRKPLSDAFKIKEKERLNADGKIDLVDFSIMAFYWTG